MKGTCKALGLAAGVSLLAAALVALPAAAQTPPRQPRDAAAQRSSQTGVEGLERGAQWSHRGQAYALVPQVRAVGAQGAEEAPATAFTRAGVAGGAVLERKAGFILYKQAAPARPPGGSAAPQALLAAQGDPRPVALNLRTNRLAIVLNALRVELRDSGAAQALATDMGIALGRRMSVRPVAFYTVPAGTDLVLLLNRVRADPRVAAADLELIEFTRTPR